MSYKTCPLCGGTIKFGSCIACGFIQPDIEALAAIYDLDPNSVSSEAEPRVPREVTPDYNLPEIYPNREEPVSEKPPQSDPLPQAAKTPQKSEPAPKPVIPAQTKPAAESAPKAPAQGNTPSLYRQPQPVPPVPQKNIGRVFVDPTSSTAAPLQPGYINEAAGRELPNHRTVRIIVAVASFILAIIISVSKNSETNEPKTTGYFVDFPNNFTYTTTAETAATKPEPPPVRYIEAIPMVDTSGYRTIALKADGTVLTAGNSLYDDMSHEDWDGIVQVAAGEDGFVGLKDDGTVVVSGDFDKFRGIDSKDLFVPTRETIRDWTDIIQISADYRTIAALKSDGTAVTNQNDLALLISDWEDMISVCAASNFILGLKSDGTVLCASDTEYGYNFESKLSGWTDVAAIAADMNYIAGVRRDGTVVDAYSYGGRDVREWTDIVQISAGSSFTAGLKSDGTVLCASDTDYGDDFESTLSEWTNIVWISAGARHIVGLKSDGTLITAGEDWYYGADVEISEWNLMQDVSWEHLKRIISAWENRLPEKEPVIEESDEENE